MRFACFALTTLLTLVFSLPAFAQDADLIDTGKGMQLTKPGGWVDAGKKKGAVAALKSASDEKSGIEVRWAKVTAKKSAAFFNSFHASLVGAGLQKSGKAQEKAYGKLKGRLTEYATSRKEGEGMRIFVFQFHHEDAAWLIVGMFDASERANYLADYEALLTSAAWK